MVVGLVFEKYKPFLRDGTVAVIDLHRHYHRAGIDLIGNLHVFQLSFRPQFFHRHQRDIHQADKFIVSSRIEFLPRIEIALPGHLERLFIVTLAKFHFL